MEHELPIFSGFPAPESENFQTETVETFSAENTETFEEQTIEKEEVSKVKVSSFHAEIQDVSLKLSGVKQTETFSRMDTETFVKTLDISDLKGQMRNWYRRRMTTPDNLAKYKAGKKVLLDLGIPVNEISKTTLSYK